MRRSPGPAQSGPNEAANERAEDPQHGRDNAAGRVPSGHEVLGESSGEQPEYDPAEPQWHEARPLVKRVVAARRMAAREIHVKKRLPPVVVSGALAFAEHGDGPGGGIHDEEVLGKAYDARLMRRLATYVRPYWLLVAAAVALLSAEAGLQLVAPILTRRVIDVALPARDGVAIAHAAAAVRYDVSVIQFGCQYGETMLTSLLGQRVMRDLRLQLFAHLQRLPIAFFDRNPVGRLDDPRHGRHRGTQRAVHGRRRRPASATFSRCWRSRC